MCFPSTAQVRSGVEAMTHGLSSSTFGFLEDYLSGEKSIQTSFGHPLKSGDKFANESDSQT